MRQDRADYTFHIRILVSATICLVDRGNLVGDL